MKVYIQESTGAYPLTENDIKQLFPTVSFSTPFIAPDGFSEVKSSERPAVGPFEIVREAPPVFAGGWQQAWTVEMMSEEEVIARKAAHMDRIRKARDKKLRESDWIASVEDLPMSAEKKQEWLDYRQALRDLTEGGDSFTIVWPREPRRS